MKRFIKLKVLAILTSLTIPLSYFLGATYYSGSLAPYGVSPDSFPLSAADTYLQAYSFSTVLTSSASIKLLTLFLKNLIEIVGIFLAIVVVSALFLHKAKQSSKKEVKSKDKVEKKETDIEESDKTKRQLFMINLRESFAIWLPIGGYAFASIYALLVLALLLLGLFVFPYEKGKEYAKSQRDTYIEKGCFYKDNENWSNCTTLYSKDGKEIVTGLLVARSLTHIAFFNDEGSVTLQIPQGSLIKKRFRKVALTEPDKETPSI